MKLFFHIIVPDLFQIWNIPFFLKTANQTFPKVIFLDFPDLPDSINTSIMDEREIAAIEEDARNEATEAARWEEQ